MIWSKLLGTALKSFGTVALNDMSGFFSQLKGLGMNGLSGSLTSALNANTLGFLLGGSEGARSMRAGITNAELTGAQREQNAFNAEQAQLSRDFSEMQRQTQYQTAVNDMTAAGLNPAMMYQGAGQAASPTPSAQATGNASQVDKLAVMMSMAEMSANISKIQAEANEANASAKLLGSKNIFQGYENKYYEPKAQAYLANMSAQTDLYRAEIANTEEDTKVKEKTIELFGTEIAKNEAEAALKLAQTSGVAIDNAIKEATKDDVIRFQTAYANYEEELVKLTRKQGKLTDEEIQNAQKLREKLEKEITGLGLDNMLKQLKYDNLADFDKDNPLASQQMYVASICGSAIAYGFNMAAQVGDRGSNTANQVGKGVKNAFDNGFFPTGSGPMGMTLEQFIMEIFRIASRARF